MLVATVAGILSACMSYGFAAGKPIAELAVRMALTRSGNTRRSWSSCWPVVSRPTSSGAVILNARNGTAGDYVDRRFIAAATGFPKPGEGARHQLFSVRSPGPWYLQFFFYGMGTTLMGKFDFSSWTLHMASIMIFGTLWGLVLHEWKGSSRTTLCLVALGLAVLVASTVAVGYGNYLGTLSPPP